MSASSLRSLVSQVPDPNNPAVQGYRNQPKVIGDCEEVMGHYRSLTPKIATLVHNNGEEYTLLSLQGTIPMFVNSTKYNCPMTFWIPLDYPTTQPTCYVSPTQDMMITPRHTNVDAAGFVYHLYLTQWNDNSTIKVLCDTLSALFSKDPPVFARTRSAVSSNTSSYNPSTSAAAAASSSSASSSQATSSMGSHGLAHGAAGGSRPTQPPPPPPPRPSPPPLTAAEIAEVERIAAEREERERELQRERERVRQMEREREAERERVRQEEREIERKRQELENEKMELQAVCSSKLQVMLDAFLARSDEEFEMFQGKQQKLEETQAQIASAKAALAQEKQKLSSMLDDLDLAESQVLAWKSAREGSGEKSVEESIGYSDALSKQLFECTAQDKAIEDALYQLDKALGNETIDCKRYMTLVRKYSKQQFFIKELANRIIQQRRLLGVL